MAQYQVAVDVGGTFTDLVAFDIKGRAVRLAKVPSTPPDFYSGVVSAIEQITPDFSDVELFVHGTTAHLNAFLERKGARCALLTTRGFADIYEMRRGARPEAYDLHFRYPDPLVPRRNIFEVDERLDGAGRVLIPLDEAQLDPIIEALRNRNIQSVGICFLHSYRNPEHERRAADYLRSKAPELFVTPSVEVCREWREYERTSTVAMNAYVSPILGNYLRRLRSALNNHNFQRKVHLMQSHGGLLGAESAESRGVLTLMSGPVGGNVGCRMLSHQIGEPRLICVDMGGTSFDISLIINGESAVASEKMLAGQPVLAPMVDIHTIGAGGGSIARIDAGSLRVGPHSAGASPGPACYNRGGTEPTVTDANLLLGRLDSSRLFGGNIELHTALAQAALARLGEQLQLSPLRMAEGILEVVNAQMANAIRTMTIRRGIDPREFALVAFGGAGPMHAVFLAEELGIQRVIVPGAAGAFSAWGMLETEIRHDVAQTYIVALSHLDAADIDRRFAAQEEELQTVLQDEGVAGDKVRYQRSFDMRYVGQEHFINVPLPEDGSLHPLQLRQQFGTMYRQIFGHSNLAEEVEVVNLRTQARSPLPHHAGGDLSSAQKAAVTAARDRGAAANGAQQAAPRSNEPVAPEMREVIFGGRAYSTRFTERDAIVQGQPLDGPLIVQEESCTTVVPPGYRTHLLPTGHLLIQRITSTEARV
jgi:N-methylhydantoinase A